MVSGHRAFLLAACSVLGVIWSEGAANANGRFPRAEHLLERDGDPNQLVLTATYGLLLTNDRGAEWRHVCELGFAFVVDQIDPLAGLFSDASMLVKGARSLNRAPSPYCAFEPVLGGVGSESVADFSVDLGDQRRVVALLLRRGDTGGSLNLLYESTDAGQTFAVLGEPLPETSVASGVTLDAAPSDRNRLYVSAIGTEVPGLLARSDDRGASWTTSELALEADETPYIAAVDPRNADVIYVRTDRWAPNAEGIYEANDALFYSDDGGTNFREIHRAAGKLFGFALSPDGSEVLVGYGDPVDPSRAVDAAVLGIYRAATSDLTFTKIYEGSVSCLAWTENGLYVCTSQDERGFALGFAPSAAFELDTPAPLSPLLRLPDVKGPLDCPSCTSAGDCVALWSETCATFGNCDAGPPPLASDPADCSSAGAGGEGGAPGTTEKSAGAPDDASCGCRSARAATDVRGVAWLLLAALALLRRRPRALSRAIRRVAVLPPARPAPDDYNCSRSSSRFEIRASRAPQDDL